MIFIEIYFLYVEYAVNAIVTKVDAARCQEYLNHGGCNLSACKEQCIKEKNGEGQCIPNSDLSDYACVCFYNC